MIPEGFPSRARPSSFPASPPAAVAAVRVLAAVDELAPGATGALHFGEHGVILVQSRRICWAMAHSMRVRLTDIWRLQSIVPLSREALENLYEGCKRTGTPLGEALVAGGLATEASLKAALFRHNAEAIAALARSGAKAEGFVSHRKAGYDPKFTFSSCAMLGMLGALEEPLRAACAEQVLKSMLVAESCGAAFTRGGAGAGVSLVAVDAGCDFLVRDLVEICNWVSGMFDVAQTFDHKVFAARAAWPGRAALVAWRQEDISYVGLCSSRAAAARLMSQLSPRASSESARLPVAGREGSADS